MRRSSRSTAWNGPAGSGCSVGRSSAKCSATTRRVVACDAHIGDLIEPLPELGVEIVEIAEAAAEEEVLADVAERPLDLALRLGPVRPAGLRQIAVVAGELEQGAVVDDVAGLGILAAEHGPHAVVEDLLRHAAERLEGGGMAAQQGLQVLVQRRSGPTACGCGRAPARTARRSARRRARR